MYNMISLSLSLYMYIYIYIYTAAGGRLQGRAGARGGLRPGPSPAANNLSPPPDSCRQAIPILRYPAFFCVFFHLGES